MLKSKYFLILVSLFFITRISFAQSFNYSGPTSVTIPFGSSTAAASYSFSYSGLSGLYYPGLIIAVDGSVINNGLCNNPTTPSNYSINLTQGSHIIKFSLMSINGNTLNCYDPVIHKVVEFTVNVNFRISVENNFGGGTIYANSNTTSPALIPVSSGSNVSVAAIEQDYNSYHWIWNTSGTYNSSWIKIPSGSGSTVISYSQSTSYSVQSNDMNTRVEAGLRKVCDATFSNSFSGGVININGSAQNSPVSTQVVEANTVTVTAQQLYENYNNSGLDYSFSNWDGGSTSLSKSFTIYNHEQHTANYIRKANTSQVFEWDFTNVAVGNNIRLTWNEHPNTNVTQYKIWRRDKNGTESYIGTVNRGTTSFTDYDYQYASENDPDKGTLFYNVSVYCSLDGGSWSSDGMKLVT